MKSHRSFDPIALAAAGLLLAGCSTLDSQPLIPKGLTAKPCPPERCDLEVTVKDCKIAVSDEVVEVRDRDNIMRWTIVSPGYEFDGRGIRFSWGTPFQALGSNDPKVARVLNRNDRSGTREYKYDIHIKGCPALDPYVRNIR